VCNADAGGGYVSEAAAEVKPYWNVAEQIRREVVRKGWEFSANSPIMPVLNALNYSQTVYFSRYYTRALTLLTHHF